MRFNAFGTVSTFSLATATLLFALGCGSDDKNPDVTNNANAPALYAVQHNVNAPDGRLVYVNVIPSLDTPGEALKPANAIELSGYAAMQSFNGALYISNGEKRTITKWNVDPNGKLVPGPALSLANEELGTFWNENFLYIDANTAWYANERAKQIIVWNPTSMELVGRIPMPGLDKSALPAAFQGMVRIGDRVLLPVMFADWDTYTALPEVGSGCVVRKPRHRVGRMGRRPVRVAYVSASTPKRGGRQHLVHLG